MQRERESAVSNRAHRSSLTAHRWGWRELERLGMKGSKKDPSYNTNIIGLFNVNDRRRHFSLKIQLWGLVFFTV